MHNPSVWLITKVIIQVNDIYNSYVIEHFNGSMTLIVFDMADW